MENQSAKRKKSDVCNYSGERSAPLASDAPELYLFWAPGRKQRGEGREEKGERELLIPLAHKIWHSLTHSPLGALVE